MNRDLGWRYIISLIMEKRKSMNAIAKFGIDTGASGNKVLVQTTHPGKVGVEDLILQSSAIRKVTASYYESLNLVNNRQGSHLSFDGAHWIVGEYAEGAVRRTKVNRIKKHHAVAKVLSIVGQYISEIDSPLDVEIDLMLPSNEAPYFRETEELIFKHIRSFQYGIDTVSCNPVRVQVHPEGAGFASYANVYPCSILMFGHRDVTIINLKDEQANVVPNAYTWTGYGTIEILRNFPFAFSNELTGAKLLYEEAMAWGEGGLSAMLSEEEKPITLAALKEAKDLVWTDLSDDLAADTDFMNSKRVYVGGGGSFFWGDYLADLCQVKADILAPVRKEIKTAFAQLRLSLSQQQRFIDLYLIWRQHAAPVTQLQPAPVKEVV
ncbi:ParM/StbA family protein [Acaryochloris sp. CCMEE 5410]|uniref:ParM/StbA family protein n=1 Tax=Acaryochloris sp. CCMEE 5410 TaxID=310037 RepID=UPI0002483FC3|nr:hypothetical protein [Acaryochloris sp. CCMEE 5410]